MSTETGGREAAEELLSQSQQLVTEAQADELRQMELLDPVTPEDMLEAREALGPSAGNYAVIREARKRKRGRPPGARNKRTEDFDRYLRQFGPDPAVTLMQIQATPQEVLIENSRRIRRRVRTERGVEIDVMQTMTYEAATSLRIRCAEALMPYLHGKKPLQVDLSFSGLSDLIIPGVTHTAQEAQDIMEADYLPVDDVDFDNPKTPGDEHG